MSLEQLEAFILAVQANPHLQRQCAGTEAADADVMAEIARGAGFDVHSADLVRFQDGALVEYCEEDYFMKPRWWVPAEPGAPDASTADRHGY